MEDINKIIEDAAIENALKYGKASFDAVAKKVFSQIKVENKKDVIEKIREVVEKINNLSKEEIEKIAAERNIIIVKKVKEYEFPELPNVKGKVVTAFPPEPSKYPHLGHAKAAFINWYYASKYNGKFILRFEDSNPEKAKREYYDAFRNALKWLELNWQEEDVLSLHLEEYYDAVYKLIIKNKAYVCTCEREKIKKYRKEGIECEHRNQSIEENLKLWERMLSKELNAIVRAKIDMNHKNAAMRDPALVRISFHKHPITGEKYHVWPLYDFGTALLDHWEGITHRFRSKEFEMRTELQNWIREALGIKEHPTIMEIARFEIKGFLTSGRKIRELIEKKVLEDWSDIRLITIDALKRRGFLPQAIKDFLYRTGISKAEGNLEFEMLESINRQHLDKLANRYFFVDNPIRLKVLNAKTKIAKIKYHPDFEDRGYREILTKGEFFISKNDFENLKVGDEVRLIDVYNIKILEKTENEIVAEYIGEELKKEIPKIHWISLHDDFVKVNVIKPNKLFLNGELNPKSLEIISGLGESHIKNLFLGERVQFVRFGFVKLEKIVENVFTFIFIHK
ncbi:MAG: glutamate--tRNA ligase [Candidatus Aenigmatarchaeota archaeon]